MESILFSFSEFPEDVQVRILSMLDRLELEAYARTSKNFLALCRYDERLWFLKCSRRWGSDTQIQKWGGGKVSYRNLFHLLNQYEELVGVWQPAVSLTSNISTFVPSNLVFFDWGSCYITGYRMVLSQCGGCCVMKQPFMWMTVTDDGQVLTYLDTTNGGVSLTEEDLLSAHSEKLHDERLIIVDIRDIFCGRFVQENPKFFEFRRRLSTRKRWEEYENVFRSPPDRLMTEINKILARNLRITDETISKRQRRRERQREREKWRRVPKWHSQELRKPWFFSPTPRRPLQGLWKGISPNGSLNFYRVCYDETRSKIYCENIGSSSTTEPLYKTVFTSLSTAFVESPYPPGEESTYNSRIHLRPQWCEEENQPRRHNHVTSSDDYEVVRIYYADLTNNMHPMHLLFDDFGDATESILRRDADGRVWLYTNGTFGFGCLQDDYIIDLNPII